MSGLEWIRKNYGVPARRGCRVEYTGRCGVVERGVITSARGGYIRVRLDYLRHSIPFHPTWEMRYLPTNKDTSHGNG